MQYFKKYKSAILYLFFGGCTTVINIAVYDLCFNIIGINNLLSTIIAWVVSVLFAYVTNRKYVFESKATKTKDVLYEISSFFACRGATGVLDVAIMWVTVDILNWNALLWKTISNVIVIVINYVASKLIIFKKK